MKTVLDTKGVIEPEENDHSSGLENVMDPQALQTVMDAFYRLTHIGIGVLDLQGRVLVKTGWQDICTKFHRVHPETRKNCLESDTLLSSGLTPGTFKHYRCKNNMWDMATPIVTAGKHIGNIFLGQFFFEDELPDYDLFRDQARKYGFDEAEYMAALDRVPRWSRETVEAAMTFYSRLAQLIAAFRHDIAEYQTTERNLIRQNDLLASVRSAQSLFISEKDSRKAYKEILHTLVQETGSAYGFLDEVLYETDGTPYKVSLALSDISWSENSRNLYEQLMAQKLEFRNLNNLAGAPVLENCTIIANDVPNHTKYRGLPKGHPPLHSYMGIPLYFGNEIIGVAGVANREGGYTEELADFIKPLTQACSAMIWSGRLLRREQESLAERKRFEEALRKERDRMQRYLDTTKSFIVALDETGNVTMINRYGLQLLGYGEERILGKNWFDVALPQPEGRETVYPVFLEVMKGNINQAAYFENDVITASGERRTIAWSNTYLCDEKGRRTGTLSTGLDITEQKRAEEQVRMLQKAESLGRMAGAIAHHFNNKLGVVMGNLEIALEDLPESAPVREFLFQALEGARLSAEVSRMMLTYLGQVTGMREPMDLSHALSGTLHMLKAATPAHVLLTADLPVTGPVVEANGGEIQQVLANLVTNAWESIGENGGVVRLKVRTIAGTDIPKSHRFPVGWTPQAEAYACMEVRDSGSGIEEENMEMLFDPFYSTKFTGRGLGLPAALGIVRAHRGVITVGSRFSPQKTDPTKKAMGTGSVFRVFLPLAEDCFMKAAPFSQ